MAENIPLEDIKIGKESKTCRYFKAKVLDSHLSEDINQAVQQSIDNQSIVFTDKSTSYVDIADFVELLITEKIRQTDYQRNFKMSTH